MATEVTYKNILKARKQLVGLKRKRIVKDHPSPRELKKTILDETLLAIVMLTKIAEMIERDLKMRL